MIRTFLNSKIHGCICTDVDLDYEGSILIDEDWIDEVGLLIHEQVDVYNKTNGNRHTTYVLPLPRGSNEVSVNGAGAHLTNVGDELIICSYIQLDDNMETLQAGKLVHEFNIANKMMHMKHQPEMMKMVENEILLADSIDKEKMKKMAKIDKSMGHSHNNSVLLEPNQKADIIWKFDNAINIEIACNVPGHYQAGMIAKVDIN